MLKKILYTLWLFVFFIALFAGLKCANVYNFIQVMENKTFDIRQNLIVQSGNRVPNKNIVVVAVDDASYEYILDKYGEWPLPRNIYAKTAEYIESQNPQSVVFDLMFVKSLKSSNDADNSLINLVKKYNNIFMAMNFDNQEETLRIPPELPDNLSLNVTNNSPNVDFSSQTYTNCRKILDGIINSTENIGVTNVTRSEDGVLRKVPAFVKYNNKYYPQLGMAVGLHYLKSKGFNYTKNFVIDSNSNLIVGKNKFYLDKDAGLILNWYGKKGTYKYIPLYKLIKVVNGELPADTFNFENDIVYFGTSAASLFDIKTVPVDKTFPGVEVQTTFVNNIIDNSFIRKIDLPVTIFIAVLLSLITMILIMNISSVFVGTVSCLSLYMIYMITSYFVLRNFNLWIDIVHPIILSILTFTFAYIIKYIVKSKDFDRQYKLATTDGLTELYNHRYFQEQMRRMIDLSKRYETQFSLIIIDIDFFKKFNDNFGHQSGDAVLRQVAQTLKSNVRASDIVCRYGGEEMSIILPNTDYDTAVYTANKLCLKVANNEFKLASGKTSNVTISLGISTFPIDGETAEDLISSADKRLYNAKSEGRNKVGNK